MQAPTTLTRSNGFNRLTAGAIGLALLAASTIGAIALNDQVELPLIGSNSQAHPTAINSMAQIQLNEQNSFDYAAASPVNALLLEENSWDYQPTANYASVASISLVEQNSFDYVTPATVQEIRLFEANSWDWDARARLASEESAPGAAPDYRLMEENSWDTDHLVYPADSGSRDY